MYLNYSPPPLKTSVTGSEGTYLAERPPKGQKSHTDRTVESIKSIYLKEYVTFYYNAMTKHFAFTSSHVNLRFLFQNLLQVSCLSCLICSMSYIAYFGLNYTSESLVNVFVPYFWKGYPKTHTAENTVHRDISAWVSYSNKLKYQSVEKDNQSKRTESMKE